MIRRIAALAVLVLALVLAACAQPSAEPAGSAPSVAPSADLPSADLPSADLPSAAPPSGEGSQTLSGTVTAGVEPNCLVLSGDGPAHLLVFHDESLRSAAKVGTSVTVVGQAQPDMMTTCQQGTPFIVVSVLPN